MTAHTAQSAATSARSETTPNRKGSVRLVNHSKPRRPTPPPVSVAQALLPVRICYAETEELASLALSLTIEFLIANLELEFRLTHRKLSPLKISNRKYSAIFYPGFRAHSPLASSKEASPPTFLIATFTNSEIDSSNCKQTRKQISNRNKSAISTPTHPQNSRSLNQNSSLDSSPLVWLRSSSLLSKPAL